MSNKWYVSGSLEIYKLLSFATCLSKRSTDENYKKTRRQLIRMYLTIWIALKKLNHDENNVLKLKNERVIAHWQQVWRIMAENFRI